MKNPAAKTAGFQINALACGPHVYFVAAHPLSPASLSVIFSCWSAPPALSLVAVSPLSPASFSIFFFSSSALPAPSSVPLQPLASGFSTTLSAPPALSLVALKPLAGVLPGNAMPPALIRLAIPRLASSFFISFFSIESSWRKLKASLSFSMDLFGTYILILSNSRDESQVTFPEACLLECVQIRRYVCTE